MILGLGTLKALIPCNDVRISQEGGEKTIDGYFWAREVIAGFLQEVKTIDPVASCAPSAPLTKSFRPKPPRRD